MRIGESNKKIAQDVEATLQVLEKSKENEGEIQAAVIPAAQGPGGKLPGGLGLMDGLLSRLGEKMKD